ncbi:MAG: pilus assembly protein [Selenomonadaceae bacterium]|nr:pilus assembly protein [Selenomonadaceae bacterium]
MFKRFKRRGQVLVFYALMIPLLFLFAGVGIDLGWYYLNVSRLQNAADAAVIAGAYKLVEQDEFSNYFVKVLTQPPSDIMEYDKVKFNNEVKKLNMADGEAEAKRYSGKNLGHIVAGDSAKIFDDWNTSSNKDNHEVTLTAALYAKIADAQWEEKGIRYYSVTLEEKVTHLFLRNFEPMNAIVKAYVMLRPHDVDLITVIKDLEDNNVIANWQYQDQYHDAAINWNHYRQTVNGKKAVSYVAGEYFRTETVNVEVQMGDGSNNGFKGTNNHSSGQKTSASKRNGQQVYYGEYDQYGGVDSLNIDFNQDIQTQFLFDWDLGAATDKKISYVTNAMDGWDATHGYDLRIQGLINFRDAWKNRNLMDEDTSNDLTPDPLWVRIESDPWWSGTKAPYVGNSTGWDSVHQMIISIDKTNTGDTTQAYNSASGDFDGYDIEGGKAYKYRPFFIFYKGPEVYDESNTVRKSQPVILNLNADWNGILYAPNSPVVILGNEKKLTGFVIAKEFVQLATKEDYTNNGYSEYQDENGKPILVKSVTASELDNEYPTADYKKTIDTEGNISFSKYKKLPKHFIVEAQYVKGISGYNDNNYVAALKKYREIYDADLKKYRAVTDNDIVQIQFPTYDAFNAENNHQIYHVVEADLMDEDLNKQYSNAKDTFLKAEYVPVVRVDTGETKYIAKENVPYVRLFREQGGKACYPYIPVCDLKKPPAVSGYGSNGVTLADDTHNVYDGKKKIVAGMEDYIVDKEGLDKWRCVSTTMTKAHKYYDSNADPYQITKTDDSGMKYFISLGEKTEVDTYNENPDVTVTYKKVGNDAYFNENETYYTYYDYPTNSKDPIEGSDQNVIHLVMDNKGNVQTKPLDEGSTEQITNSYKFQPDDRGWNKKINDPKTWEKNKDYRIPEYEVRYKKKEAFNLNKDSCYSYFQIPELHRENYEYLNVDELNQTSEKTGSDWNVEDMFFTTRRANWID